DPVGHFLKAIGDPFFIDRLDAYLKIVVRKVFGDIVQPFGQLKGQAFSIDQGGQQLPRLEIFLETVPDDLQQVLLHGILQVEVRVQALDDRFQVQQHLSENIYFHGQGHIMFRCDTVHANQQMSQLHAPVLPLLLVDHYGSDFLFEGWDIQVFPRFTDGEHDRDRGLGIPVGDGQEQLYEVFLYIGGELGDHPQIDQGDPVIGGIQDVARVGVNMDKTVLEYLLEVGPDQDMGQVPGIVLHTGKGHLRYLIPF